MEYGSGQAAPSECQGAAAAGEAYRSLLCQVASEDLRDVPGAVGGAR